MWLHDFVCFLFVRLTSRPPPPSAGHKLDAALDAFAIDVSGATALDCGLSTGGFTDCLLQRGAAVVTGVDVGYGQVAEKVRVDPRVTILERTNMRHATPASLAAAGAGTAYDVATLDVSFISVLKVREKWREGFFDGRCFFCFVLLNPPSTNSPQILPAVSALLKPGAHLVILVKPQFEAGRDAVSAGGVVRDAAVRESVVQTVVSAVAASGFEARGLIESPLRGATGGNVEYLAHFVKGESEAQRVEE